MVLYIKNMVCNRCVMVVREVFEHAEAMPEFVKLGEVSLKDGLSEKQLEDIQGRLSVLGFEILEDHKHRTIEKIKNIIIEQVQNENLDETHTFSEILASGLNKDYSYLSKLFSETENITIEKFIINQKIEKVKELLAYEELNLSEIAFKLGYSSVAHLSAQFKKITGFTPSMFRKLKDHHRKSLDQV